MRSKGTATIAAASWDIWKRRWILASSISRPVRASRAFSHSGRYDTYGVALHRRGRAGKEFRPRCAEMLREPAGAVGGHPETRGRVGSVTLRTRQDRNHGDGRRRADHRAGAEGAGR